MTRHPKTKAAAAPMADLDIAALRKLLDNATPGPWRLSPEGRGTRVEGGLRDKHGWKMVTLSRHIAPGRASHLDAKLIVAMRAALPALLDAAEERDALRAQRDALLAVLQSGQSQHTHDLAVLEHEKRWVIDDVDEVRAAIAACKETL